MIDVHHVDACPSKITVFLGSVNCEADAAVYPCDATDQHIEWYSDDPGIATVNPETGHISGVSIGKTRIFAQATNGSRAGIVVEVVPAMIEEIWLESTHRDIGCGEMDLFEANVFPEIAAGREIVWHCTDPAVLSVTPNGYKINITANKLGNAVIKATAKDAAVSDCCGFNVIERVEIDEVSLDHSVKVLGHNESFIIKSTILPENATSKKVAWSSYDDDIVTVERYDSTRAKVTSKKKDGTATIKANPFNYENNDKTGEEDNLTCTVIVDSRPTAVFEKKADDDMIVFYQVSFHDGKIWYLIGKDLSGVVNDADPLAYDRAKKNGEQAFSPEQLAFLYLLDPYGVSYFLGHYSEDYKEIMDEYIVLPIEEYEFIFTEDARMRVAACYYKDAMYELIFGEKPGYFTINDAGNRVDSDLSNGRWAVFSDAELLFGGHTILNEDALVTNLLGYALELLGGVEEFEDIIEDYQDVNDIMQIAFFSKSVIQILYEYGKWTVSKYIEDYIEKAIQSSPWGIIFWPLQISQVINGVAERLEEIFDYISIQDADIYRRVNLQPQYQLKFIGDSSEVHLSSILGLLNEKEH